MNVQLNSTKGFYSGFTRKILMLWNILQVFQRRKLSKPTGRFTGPIVRLVKSNFLFGG